MDTKKLLPTNEFQYSKEAKEYMDKLLSAFLKKVMVVTNGEDVIKHIPKLLPEYIAGGAIDDIKKSLHVNKPYLSIDKLFQSKELSKKLPKENKRVLSYLLMYLTYEILDLATNYCRDKKKKRIMQSHVEYVIKEDAELPIIFFASKHSKSSRS